MTYRWLGAWVVVGLAWAVPVRADRLDCDIGPAIPTRTCGSPISCGQRSECFVGPGTDDRTCQSVAAATSTRECIPQCTTLFGCGGNEQCPTIHGIAPTCSPTVVAPQICTWTTTSTSVPAYAQISYCPAMPGGHITESNISSCHRLPNSSPAVWTPDYFQGDCDDDGCPNGFDTNPCHSDRGACTPVTGTAVDSPYCAPLPAIACSVVGGALTCGDARACDPSATIEPCPIGTCETGWSDVPRCRPACSDLFLCALGVTYPEQCPRLGSADGVCAPLPGGITGVAGRDGVCVYSTFFDTSCGSGALGLACFQRPGGGLSENFFAGDCDGDGAPNACDTERCTPGGGTNVCSTVPGAGCTPSYTPPPDAGVDGGSLPNSDAGADGGDESDGGGNVRRDAATAGDAGTQAFDGGSSGPSVGFGGGGGCRCAAAGASRGTRWGSITLALALGIVIAQRRRPR